MIVFKIIFLYLWPSVWLLVYLTDFKWIPDGYRLKQFCLAAVVSAIPWIVYLIWTRLF